MLQAGIDKLISYLDSNKNRKEIYTLAEYSELYTECYNACVKSNDTLEMTLLYKLNIENICKHWNITVLEDFLEHFEKFGIFTKWLSKIFMYMFRRNDEDLYLYTKTAFYKLVFLPNKELLNSLIFDSYFVKKNINQANKAMNIIVNFPGIDISEDIERFWDVMIHNFSICLESQWDNTNINKYFCDIYDLYNSIQLSYIYIQTILESNIKNICICKHIQEFYDYMYKNEDIKLMNKFYHFMQSWNQDIVTNLSKIYVSYLRINSIGVENLANLIWKKKAEIKDNFEGNIIINKALNETVSEFLNDSETTWVNDIMNTVHKVILAENRDLFKPLLQLLALLEDKDIVEHLYRKKLSNRLVQATDIDVEKEFLTLMKQELGFVFTNRSEVMIKDILLNKSSQHELYSSKILQQGAWPLDNNFNCKISEELKQYQEQQEEKYLSGHPNRRLTWFPAHGEVTLTFCNYQLVMSPVQATIVLTLSKLESPISLEKLNSLTQMKESELKAILDSLKKTGVDLIDKADKKISLKENIISKKKVIHYKMPHIKVKKTKIIQKSLEKERYYSIDSFIVRTMKSKLELKQNLLLEEIFNNFKVFKPTLKIIMSRINSLVEREYIEFSDNTYKYLA